MTNLDKYPNLQAILNGTVAGSFRDWIAVRPELESLVAQVGKLEDLVTSWEAIGVGNVSLIQVIRKEAAFYKAEADSQGEINSKTHAHYKARIEELETVLKLVQRWGKDSRSVGAWEVFQEVAKALNPLVTVPTVVVDCTCVPCVCFGVLRGGLCLGCGARTCLAHELAKTSSRPSPVTRSREGHE